MRSNRRTGFSAVEGLIIVVVVVVIGALGYVFVRNLNSKTAKTSGSQSKSVPKTAAAAKSDATQVKKELESVNIDSQLDTSTIDAALQ